MYLPHFHTVDHRLPEDHPLPWENKRYPGAAPRSVPTGPVVTGPHSPEPEVRRGGSGRWLAALFRIPMRSPEF